MKNSKTLLVLASLTLLLSACGGGDNSSDNPSSGAGSSGESAGSSVDNSSEQVITYADGVYNFKSLSNEERTEITGILEKWAVDKKLTGITLYEDGGYVMYHETVEKGAPNYIKGYGYGTLSEGRLTGPLSGEEEAKYKNYYHTYGSSDPAKILYMDDDGGVVSGLVGYVSGSYYTTIMNETRTGYEWAQDLATNDFPICVDPDETGASSKIRIPVKTGSALKYSTLSSTFSSFNNREVAIEDYITPYKVYYTSAYGIRRTSEISDSNNGSIKGGDAYVQASKSGFNATAWANLGIKSGHDDQIGDYIEFTLNAPVTPFWANYYLSSSMFAPVPEDFISALGGGSFDEGVKLWGKFNNDTTLSPVDTFLSTGPYVLEEWVKDSKITFKKNPNYIHGDDVKLHRPESYNIEGVYEDIITGLKSDPEAAFKKFLNNQLHAVSIPYTKLAEFANDPRTTLVPGESTTKLNLNTCDQETWISLFGEYGSIASTPEDLYWECEPAMHNPDFVDGLSLAIDRKTLAASLGATPSCEYFGSGYMSDPENGVYYNDTDAHKNAVKDFLDGTDGFGYSLEKAKASFKKASDALLADGTYKAGDTISIEMAWMDEDSITSFGEPIVNMIKEAFDNCGSSLNLEFTHSFGDDYTYVYYDKMMIGQFDIAFGGIEGNPWDPLNFLEVLKSDNSSTFTLNWGIDTNAYPELVYDGMYWTFDALWECADHGGYVVEGKNSPTFESYLVDYPYRNEDNSISFPLYVNEVIVYGDDGYPILETSAYAMCLFVTTDPDSYSDYSEFYVYSDGTTDFNFDKFGSFVDGSDNQYWCSWDYDEDDPTLLTVTISCGFFDTINNYFDLDNVPVLGFDMYNYVNMLGNEDVVFASTIYGGSLPAKVS